MTKNPEAPGTGHVSLYGGSYRRPIRCDCDKVSYSSEADALAAAVRHAELFDTSFRAYKCPGTRRWHLATRGFRPGALKSRPRIMAWHLSTRQVIDKHWLMEALGVDSGTSKGTITKINQTLKVFAQLGLVRLNDPRPPYIAAADHDGLARVMAVGLEEYAASRGLRLRKGRRVEKPDALSAETNDMATTD